MVSGACFIGDVGNTPTKEEYIATFVAEYHATRQFFVAHLGVMNVDSMTIQAVSLQASNCLPFSPRHFGS